MPALRFNVSVEVVTGSDRGTFSITALMKILLFITGFEKKPGPKLSLG